MTLDSWAVRYSSAFFSPRQPLCFEFFSFGRILEFSFLTIVL